ncbi:MAG: xanthine dehydrogenase family protein subunit M [Hyphomicrobiaceae bacterium]
MPRHSVTINGSEPKKASAVQPFDYARPTTVDEAVKLLASEDARALAGGTDIIPDLREGRRDAKRLVDIKHIPELVAIERDPAGGWRVGAAASIGSLGRHEPFAAENAGLIEAAQLIGSLQIQARATLGGNLCTATPSGDALPLLVSLGCEAEIAGASGRRMLAVGDVVNAPRRTSLGRGELVTAFFIPPAPPRFAARYLRFTPRREMDIAVAGSGVALALNPLGEVASVRITLASVAPVPLQAKRAEARLMGTKPGPDDLREAASLAARDAAPISDTRASADYRRHLAEVLTRRALEACLAEIANREGQR